MYRCQECGLILSAGGHAHVCSSSRPTPEEKEQSARAANSAVEVSRRISEADRYMREVDRDMTQACGADALGLLVHQLLIVCPMWARDWAASVH